MCAEKTPDETQASRAALKRTATVILPEDGSSDDGAPGDSPPYEVKRRKATASKAPPMQEDEYDEMDLSSEGVVMELKAPNLYEYFLAFGIEVEEQIRICRTYASAQAAMLRCIRPKDQD